MSSNFSATGVFQTVPVTLQLLTAMRDLSETELARVAMVLAAENPVAFLQAVTTATAPKLPAVVLHVIMDNIVFNFTQSELDTMDKMAKDGEKINCIKLFRQFTDAGLKHAKDGVEFLSAEGVIGGNFVRPANSYQYRYERV